MIIKHHTLSLTTSGAPDFIDITEAVQDFVRESGAREGIVTVVSQHTTAAIRINEREAGFIEDWKGFISKLLPPTAYYRHNDGSIRTENIDCDDDRCTKNGHSHCQHMLLGTSETLPIQNGSLTLGRWQRVFLIELCSARKRQITLTVIGE